MNSELFSLHVMWKSLFLACFGDCLGSVIDDMQASLNHEMDKLNRRVDEIQIEWQLISASKSGSRDVSV